MSTDAVESVLKHLPQDMKTQVLSLSTEYRTLLETTIRFALGLGCPAKGVSDDTKQHWVDHQQRALLELRGNAPEKRSREEATEANAPSAKKQKTSPPADETNNAHIFTLNALSVSSPLRKKVDIALHESWLHLLNPSTHTTELSLPLADVKRAFLVPTRGKPKPHYTVILFSSDLPAPTSAKDKAKQPNGSPDVVQFVFGVDALPATAYTTSEGAHAKGTPVLPSLRAFLSKLPPHVSVTDLSLEDEAKLHGVQAYRRAKEGVLWFLPGGVLWDGKPCEFWDVADLVGTQPGEDTRAGTGTDGVRVVSATGRTCSVFLRRKIEDQEVRELEEDEEETIEVDETDFGMIDGKEHDGILQWVKKHHRQFGVSKQPDPAVATTPGVEDDDDSVPTAKVDKGKGKAVAPPPEEDDEDDEDDEDFVGSESDGGSPTEESESESDDGGGGGGGQDDDAEMASGEEAESESEEDLDPARHPLMQPGAMPRMSNAAMDAAVGMVMGDLLGRGDQDEYGPEEEDELDD